MIRLRPHLFALCLVLLVHAFASGQEASKAATAESSAAEQSAAADAKALELLNTIADSIPSLQSPDNRIYLASVVADLLWEKDEKRARRLFETLSKELISDIAALDPNDQRSQNALGTIQQQRREIIERMARRDPEMALSFLHATRPPQGLSSDINENLNENNLELYLAGLLANKDPELAMQMGRAALSRGVSYSLVSLLQQMNSKSPELARTLHSEMVDKLKSTDISSNSEMVNVSLNLFNAFQPPQANEDAYRKLLEVIASTVLSTKPDTRTGNYLAQNLGNQLPGMMPQIEKYAPARAVTLKQWAQQVKRTMEAGTRIYQDLNEVTQRGTVEDILALTNKYGPEQHSQIYQQAANKALAGGDISRARQIINEFIPAGPQRMQMLEQLDNQWFWNSVNGNRLVEARQALDRIKSPDRRFQLLIAMATNALNRGEHKQAEGILDEAARLVELEPSSSWKLTAQLQLAQCYVSLNAPQSVAILQSVIVLANQLVSAAVVLDGFENTYLKDGEWSRRAYSNLGNLVTSIEQNLGALARVDADNASSLANQIERPEIRVMAQLEIATALLSRGNAIHSNFRQLISNYSERRRH